MNYQCCCYLQLPPCDPPQMCPPPSPPMAINTAQLVAIGNTNRLRPFIDPIINVGNFSQPRFHQRSVIAQQPNVNSCNPCNPCNCC